MKSRRAATKEESEGSDDPLENQDDDLGFFDPHKREKIRQKKKADEKMNDIWQYILLLTRVVHLSTAMMTCSLIILNLVFDNFQ